MDDSEKSLEEMMAEFEVEPDPVLEAYIDKLNTDVLPKINYTHLHLSLRTDEKTYAKEVLKKLHTTFTDCYGAEPIGRDTPSVIVPAVIQGRDNGLTTLGLVHLTPPDSGEHWGTDFFTQNGILPDEVENRTEAENAYLKSFCPYDYYYTISMPCDCHVRWNECPAEIRDMLDACGTKRDYDAEDEWDWG